MATANPSPTRISAPLWTLWLRFDAAEPTALLGGIFAAKAGYHSYRSRLAGTDYSSGRDVAADKQGSAELAAAIDLTMSTAAMIRYTGRLDKAARARDPRLYTAAGPIIREFIGTLDGKTVYCYVLVGGRPLGVGADAGPDPGRDKSHLWHLHVSIIRRFAADAAALDGLLSVLLGETLAAWQKRTQPAVTPTPTPVPAPSQEVAVKPSDVWSADVIPAARPPHNNADFPTNPHWRASYALQAAVEAARSANSRAGEAVTELLAVRAGQAAILAAVQGLDTAAVLRRVDEIAAEERQRDATLLEALERIESGDLTADEVVRLIGERLTALPAKGN
ncbi:hypothetical protein [Verrucosispora sp. NA02020]|uniref:hypothetical protein n=1 Tax=Verrucosispora sp. NA02020 TaxID=2742132 RepID=UPI00158FD776|nr:hypothetical protein [Verrucosispora sp. NA02020]QKW15392.1 hypothetical protein HUT12_23245 [Verrucosispora sp. NA02020]